MSDFWTPDSYLRFSKDRLRAAEDLLCHIEIDRPRRIYDLGCGTGSGTRRLRQRWPDALIVAVDASAAMLAEARQLDIDATWLRADINDWSPDAPADLIYSNAALHWLDNHAVLFPRIFGWLSRGGVLAVQMPRNFTEPSHSMMAETAENGLWRDRLRPYLRSQPVADPETYAEMLLPLAEEVLIWETRYLHILTGDQPVVDWCRGSALGPMLDALPDEAEQHQFLARYAERIAVAYPARPDGITLFPFRRLFIVARRRRD